MNYIHTLQEENKALTSEIQALKDQLTDLRTYLHSSKFYEDTTVQVSDVLRRLPH